MPLLKAASFWEFGFLVLASHATYLAGSIAALCFAAYALLDPRYSLVHLPERPFYFAVVAVAFWLAPAPHILAWLVRHRLGIASDWAPIETLWQGYPPTPTSSRQHALLRTAQRLSALLALAACLLSFCLPDAVHTWNILPDNQATAAQLSKVTFLGPQLLILLAGALGALRFLPSTRSVLSRLDEWPHVHSALFPPSLGLTHSKTPDASCLSQNPQCDGL